ADGARTRRRPGRVRGGRRRRARGRQRVHGVVAGLPGPRGRRRRGLPRGPPRLRGHGPGGRGVPGVAQAAARQAAAARTPHHHAAVLRQHDPVADRRGGRHLPDARLAPAHPDTGPAAGGPHLRLSDARPTERRVPSDGPHGSVAAGAPLAGAAAAAARPGHFSAGQATAATIATATTTPTMRPIRGPPLDAAACRPWGASSTKARNIWVLPAGSWLPWGPWVLAMARDPSESGTTSPSGGAARTAVTVTFRLREPCRRVRAAASGPRSADQGVYWRNTCLCQVFGADPPVFICLQQSS